MTERVLFISATVFQALAVVYAVYLARRRAGRTAWLWLLGAMLSMLTWRVVHMFGVIPPYYFNPAIAMWGSLCMMMSMFFFATEVARRETAERERDALLQSERAARESSDRANRVKDQFLGALSHELRTPLTAIIGWCDLARVTRTRAATASDTAAETFDVIERNARTLARLVDDLLDVTRIAAGTMRIDNVFMPLAQPIRAAIETVQSAAQRKSITMHCSVDDSINVNGDPLRLQQVFWNLLTNAIKFTPQGGRIEVIAERTASTNGHNPVGPTATVLVRDNGIGITPEFMPQLFTRFRQAEAAVDRKFGGLGMGLSIVKTLVESHGGAIGCQSDGAGKGATFTITLPTSESPPAAGAPSQARRDRKVLSKLRVIVLDDEPDIRTMVQRVLESHGATVWAAASALEAAELIDRHAPQVLVSDIGMPGMDGYAFMRSLRSGKHPQSNDLKAIAVTAYSRDVDRQLAMDAGFDAHLSKPINAHELVTTIAQLSGLSREPATAS